LEYDPTVAASGEHTLFGGLKTKAIDVTVSIPGIGPVIAISMKGTLTAFRNLTNRMEEAAGDCTNIHLAYPGLVYAFWHIFRANVQGRAPQDTPALLKLDANRHFRPADIALHSDRGLSSYLARYLFAMERLFGRKDMRDDPSAYEAVGITLVDVSNVCGGEIVTDHPTPDSALRHDKMFDVIYRQYDLRFVYQSPALQGTTRRISWSENSPAISAITGIDFQPRIGVVEQDEDESDAMEDATEDS